MVNEQEVGLPENPKPPMGFRHLGSSSFSEVESQTSKLPYYINGSTNTYIRLCL